MSHEEEMRRTVEQVDVERLPEWAQRIGNVLLNQWSEQYGAERPSKLPSCSECQDECHNECPCWCHGGSE